MRNETFIAALFDSLSSRQGDWLNGRLLATLGNPGDPLRESQIALVTTLQGFRQQHLPIPVRKRLPLASGSAVRPASGIDSVPTQMLSEVRPFGSSQEWAGRGAPRHNGFPVLEHLLKPILSQAGNASISAFPQQLRDIPVVAPQSGSGSYPGWSSTAPANSVGPSSLERSSFRSGDSGDQQSTVAGRSGGVVSIDRAGRRQPGSGDHGAAPGKKEPEASDTGTAHLHPADVVSQIMSMPFRGPLPVRDAGSDRQTRSDAGDIPTFLERVAMPETGDQAQSILNARVGIDSAFGDQVLTGRGNRPKGDPTDGATLHQRDRQSMPALGTSRFGSTDPGLASPPMPLPLPPLPYRGAQRTEDISGRFAPPDPTRSAGSAVQQKAQAHEPDAGGPASMRLLGGVQMSGRRVGQAATVHQVREASLPMSGQSRVNLRSASLYSGTRIPQ